MSKAFTRESETATEETFVPPWRSQLPPGAKNYITEGGVRHLHEELDNLTSERSELASRVSDESAKRRLQWIEARAAYLDQSLGTAVAVPTPPPPHDQVRFGATVKVRESSGAETEYRIVGVDETDLDQNWISFFSPIARALMNQSLGAHVRFRIPAGEQSLEILSIRYIS
jgi:transcription elongation factor GreB